MDYFKATEYYLYNYKSIKASIVNLEMELQEDPLGTSAMKYDFEKTSQTHNISSSVESEVITIEKRKEHIQKEIAIAKYTIRKIDNAVESLGYLEKRIIMLKYLNDERLTWKQISRIVRYSWEYCRKDVRNQALEKISISLFGVSNIKTPILSPTYPHNNVV